MIESQTAITLTKNPVFATGDFQDAALFFSSKMVVPSVVGLFTTFVAEFQLVGLDLSAPQKVRTHSYM